MNLQIINADCREGIKQIPDASVQCVVTSPPYWGLRSYLRKENPLKHLEIGQEKSPPEFVENLRAVFKEIWRVLRDDGTVWLNLGDSYAGSGCGWSKNPNGKQVSSRAWRDEDETKEFSKSKRIPRGAGRWGGGNNSCELAPKNLIGIPWLVAFALQSDGWYLRSDIIWHKQNPMPESVKDRPTRSHEYIFLLTKSANYYFDCEAIKEPASEFDWASRKDRANGAHKTAPTTERNGIRPRMDKQRGHSRRHEGFNSRWDAMEKSEQCSGLRNKRDVWTVSPAQYPEAHFATFPPELIKPCILAGSRPCDTVLDPFGGSGTTGEVSLELGRKAILIELNQDYLPLIEQRANVTMGLKLT